MLFHKNLNTLNHRFKALNFVIFKNDTAYVTNYMQPIFLLDRLLVKSISSSSIFNYMFSYKRNFFFIFNTRHCFYLRKLNFLFSMNTNLGGLSGSAGSYSCYNSRLLQVRPRNYILV